MLFFPLSLNVSLTPPMCVCWHGFWVDHDWPHRDSDHQKNVVMAAFYVYSEPRFKRWVGHGQWECSAGIARCGLNYFVCGFASKILATRLSTFIFLPASLFFLFPLAISLYVHFSDACNLTICLACCVSWVPVVELACTLQYLHLFSFWCVWGRCFLLFNSTAFCCFILIS